MATGISHPAGMLHLQELVFGSSIRRDICSRLELSSKGFKTLYDFVREYRRQDSDDDKEDDNDPFFCEFVSAVNGEYIARPSAYLGISYQSTSWDASSRACFLIPSCGEEKPLRVSGWVCAQCHVPQKKLPRHPSCEKRERIGSLGGIGGRRTWRTSE